MAISKDKKKQIIEKLNDVFNKAKSVVFVNFHGLTVGDTTLMRKTLRENGVSYVVAKKTLTNLALKDKKFEGEVPTLDGELGVVSGDDDLTPAREVYSFIKKFDDKLSILGGVFENKYMNKEEMMSIAQIPDAKTLQAQFVNVINSPIQGFVVALSQIAENKS